MNTPKNYQAVIFDVDGLLLDTERIYIDCFQKAASEHGKIISEEDYHQVIGRSIPDFERIFTELIGDADTFQKIHKKCTGYIAHHFETKGIPKKTGTLEIINFVESLNLAKAVATSSREVWAQKKLRLTNLHLHFDIVTTGDEVKEAKPDPEIFLITADKLQVDPQRIIVLEDSEAGIQAAHCAGMTAIQVPDIKEPSEDTRQLAFDVCQDLLEAQVVIQKLISS